MGERTRQAGGFVGLERLVAAVRLAHRSLLRTPGQALAAILTLGLGIGVATTMFGTIYGAFYRALPWDDPQHFVWLERTNPLGERLAVSPHDFEEWRQASRSFRDLAAAAAGPAVLRTSSETLQLAAASVTWNALDVLGTQPILGRGFLPDDDRPGAPLVAVISQRVWERRLDADPGVIGREVVLNGEPANIVGVVPDGFHFPESQDLWVPLRLDPDLLPRGEGPGLTVFGHLDDGVTREEARAEAGRLAERTTSQHPETNEGIGATVTDYAEKMNAGAAILINWMLMLAALAVLLIACVNVANLLLARAARRAREAALRAALGAGRARIVAQMLAESSALGLYGAVVGAGIGWLGVAGIRQGMATVSMPYWIRFEVDAVVLLFAIVAAAGAGILAGLIPGLHLSRGDLVGVLRDGGRGSTGLQVGRLSRGLVGVQVAFSVCLLVVSGLMVKSVVSLASYQLPFTAERVLVTSVDLLDGTETDRASRAALVAELLERAGEIPQVEAVALASGAPGRPTPRSPWEIDGRPHAADQDYPRARTMTVSPAYFELLQVEPIAGRAFSTLDVDGGAPVAIVNRSFADTHFGNGDPLGRRIRTPEQLQDAAGAWRVVVGVVPDLMMQGLDQVSATRGDGVYIPAVEADGLPSTLLLRARGEPLDLVAGLRDLARTIRPDLAVLDVQTLPEVLERSTWYITLTSRVFVAFGAAALFLASAGILGLVAAESERRTQEVGVRVALGARTTDVVRLIVGLGVRQMVVGVTAGVVMAMGLARAMAIVLFDTDPSDPGIYGVTVAAVVLVGVMASAYPALRAARADPVRSLQAE